MSTDKSLKHLKSKDKFLIANVSNYFERHLIIFRQLGSAAEPFSEYEKNYGKPVHFRRRNARNGDNTNLWTTLMRLLSETMCRSLYTHRHQLPTINNLLSVLKTDIV